jgi:hypothetical protein
MVEREPFAMSCEESHRSKVLLIIGRYSFSASATAALRGPDQLTKIFIFSRGSCMREIDPRKDQARWCLKRCGQKTLDKMLFCRLTFLHFSQRGERSATRTGARLLSCHSGNASSNSGF